MNPTLITGMIIVTGALIAYSVFFWMEQHSKLLKPAILAMLTLGISLDITATTFMIIGSRNLSLTVHGVLGYTALSGMLLDTILTWRHWRSEKKTSPLSRGLLRYTRLAYGWWVLAYIAGGLLVAFGLR